MSEQHPEHQEASNAARIAQLFETIKIMSDSIGNLTRAGTDQLASIERLHRRLRDIENPSEAPHA